MDSMGRKRYLVIFNLVVIFYIVYCFAMDVHYTVVKVVVERIEIDDLILVVIRVSLGHII